GQQAHTDKLLCPPPLPHPHTHTNKKKHNSVLTGAETGLILFLMISHKTAAQCNTIYSQCYECVYYDVVHLVAFHSVTDLTNSISTVQSALFDRLPRPPSLWLLVGRPEVNLPLHPSPSHTSEWE